MNYQSNALIQIFWVKGGGRQSPAPFVASLYMFWHPAYQIITAHITI